MANPLDSESTKRLFVDVDDTLVIYEDPATEGQPHPYGVYMRIPWHPNIALVAGVRDFRRLYPHALIVIWSSGGQEYATLCADLLFPGLDVTPLAKVRREFGLVRPDDIVVDDMAESLRIPAPVLKPDEWPA